MRDVFFNLRVKCFSYRLRLENFWTKITKPFQIAFACIKRYLDLGKIEKESEGRWERHVKIQELKNQDELEVRKSHFSSLKIQIICTFFRTSCAGSRDELQKQPNEVETSRKEFQKNKEELINLVEQLSDYDEITFDENIKSEIIAWEFGKFERQEKLTDWEKSFVEYIRNLDII